MEVNKHIRRQKHISTGRAKKKELNDIDMGYGPEMKLAGHLSDRISGSVCAGH